MGIEGTIAGASSAEDVAILSALDEAAAQETPTDQGQPSEQVKPNTTNQPTEGTESASADPAATQEKTEEKRGDLRNALRAARHGEKRLKQQLEEANRQLEELRKAQPQQQSEADLSDDEIAAIEADFPAQGKALRKMRDLEAKVQQLTAAAPQAASQQPEWTPPEYEPEVQMLIDEVPDLLEWQNDPNSQDKFELAIKYDQSLYHDPDWSGRSAVERFAEAAKRVKEKTSTAPANASQTRKNPDEVIANAQASTPRGISDFRGGVPPNKIAPNYSKMSDEEILASLPVSD
jgi:chromosome segregation ATPase